MTASPLEVFPLLSAAVERHITEYGVTSFIVGHYGSFDKLAAKSVIAAKKIHPHITLTLLLPYHPAQCPIPTPKGFDETFYPSDMEHVPQRLAIVRANRYMVEHVEHVIAYSWHPASNSQKILEYAQKREARGLLTVENLAESLK